MIDKTNLNNDYAIDSTIFSVPLTYAVLKQHLMNSNAVIQNEGTHNAVTQNEGTHNVGTWNEVTHLN